MQNFPTVGLIDGTFRQNLEETDMGYDKEVEMIAAARELDLLTCPYVFTEDEAEAMAKAGADVLIPHMGLTTKGSIGAKTALTLADAAKRVQALCRRGEGGQPRRPRPLPRRPDRRAGGRARTSWRTRRASSASSARRSIERLPTEVAITDCARRFKALTVKR